MTGLDANKLDDGSVRNGLAGEDYPSTTHRVVEDRVFRTVCLFVCFAVLGLAAPLLGNTIVHLERFFDVDTATMSLAFTISAIGYLAGAFLCGLVFDRVNHELAFATANLVEGLGTIVAPFSGSLAAFITCMTIQAVAQGFIDASGQSYCVGLWTGHRRREPILQAVHAIWSLGGTISPFIIARFLVELPASSLDNVSTTSSTANESTVTSLRDSFSFSPSSNWNQTTATLEHVDVSCVAKVRFAFVAIGSVILVASLLFIIAYFRSRSRRAGRDPVVIVVSESSTDIDDGSDPEPSKSSPSAREAHATKRAAPSAASSKSSNRLIYLIFISLMFLFYHLYLYVEMIPVAYLTSFTVKYLNFSVQNASLLMSVFFGFHFAGRALGIPLSTFLRPRTMVLVDLSMTAVAYLMLLAFVNVWPAIVWPSAALAGLSMATTFATAILWIGDNIPVTGRVSSILLVGSSLGGVLGPLFVGRMFESSTPMWFVYVVVMASVSHVVLFVGLMVFVRKYGDRLKEKSPRQLERRDRLEEQELIKSGAEQVSPT